MIVLLLNYAIPRSLMKTNANVYLHSIVRKKVKNKNPSRSGLRI